MNINIKSQLIWVIILYPIIYYPQVLATPYQLNRLVTLSYNTETTYPNQELSKKAIEQKIPVAMNEAEIEFLQNKITNWPIGKRIAYWAARFIGTKYDPDPLGLYVRSNRIVTDEAVDCMYHTFRAVELAQSRTPHEAIQKALNLRFISRGELVNDKVTNYDQRFQYGEDMVYSGKWGQNITSRLGRVRRIKGSRGRSKVTILPKSTLKTRTFRNKLQDGDIVFWVKNPRKRVVGEIVAHLSIVHIKKGRPYIIHASGLKRSRRRAGGGVVKEVLFSRYVRKMSFIGAFITRF
ncbi:hypothetical protein TI05_06185 [Achromatium sp. WMS3]|nr:hypothetical protein TI05_06185 [Achromatium sp. WMS3]